MEVMELIMKKVLTIAGSDSLSGGGLQADLRTFSEYRLAAENVVTCIVSVEPETDKVSIQEVFTLNIEKQLMSIDNDLLAIKIGMLGSIETGRLVASFLRERENIPVVLDPVLALKESGFESNQKIIDFFKQELLPQATITTPNLKEAELLSGMNSINNLEDMKVAAVKIYQTGVKNVVIKGGQRLEGKTAYDVLYNGREHAVLEQEKLSNGFNNGAGCTFASAICGGIANGMSVEMAVKKAKIFVYESIKYGIPFLPELGNVYQGGINRRNDVHNEY